MSVWLGNYNYPNDNGTAYQRQRQAIVDAINTYGTSNIAGITVGNEFMLKFVHRFLPFSARTQILTLDCSYLTAQGSNNPNSAIGNTGAKILIADIQDTRTTINSMNLPKHIPIGNSDAGSYFNTLVLEAVDYGVSYLLLGIFTRRYMIHPVFKILRWQTYTLGSATYRSMLLQGGPMTSSKIRMSTRPTR
jgi:hypothetical protein